MYGSIEEINKSLVSMRWKQADGPKMYLNSIGEQYVECGWSFPAREADVPMLEILACKRLADSILHLASKFSPETHSIEWRKRPECAVSDYPLVVEYRPDGPDMDYVTDRQCVMDKDFKLVKTYARLSFVPITD